MNGFDDTSGIDQIDIDQLLDVAESEEFNVTDRELLKLIAQDQMSPLPETEQAPMGYDHLNIGSSTSIDLLVGMPLQELGPSMASVDSINAEFRSLNSEFNQQSSGGYEPDPMSPAMNNQRNRNNMNMNMNNLMVQQGQMNNSMMNQGMNQMMQNNYQQRQQQQSMSQNDDSTIQRLEEEKRQLLAKLNAINEQQDQMNNNYAPNNNMMGMQQQQQQQQAHQQHQPQHHQPHQPQQHDQMSQQQQMLMMMQQQMNMQQQQRQQQPKMNMQSNQMASLLQQRAGLSAPQAGGLQRKTSLNTAVSGLSVKEPGESPLTSFLRAKGGGGASAVSAAGIKGTSASVFSASSGVSVDPFNKGRVNLTGAMDRSIRTQSMIKQLAINNNAQGHSNDGKGGGDNVQWGAGGSNKQAYKYSGILPKHVSDGHLLRGGNATRTVGMYRKSSKDNLLYGLNRSKGRTASQSKEALNKLTRKGSSNKLSNSALNRLGREDSSSALPHKAARSTGVSKYKFGVSGSMGNLGSFGNLGSLGNLDSILQLQNAQRRNQQGGGAGGGQYQGNAQW